MGLSALGLQQPGRILTAYAIYTPSDGSSNKSLYALRRINKWLGNKDFNNISQAGMEAFISRLEANQLTVNKKGKEVSVRYKEWTQRDFKVILRKFYKWLLGANTTYPGIVSWIDTSIQEQPPPSLTLEEIKKCVDFTPNIKGKALVWALFETGARAEEFLNIRVGHVEDKQSHLLACIQFSKTYQRTLPIFEGAQYLREWLSSHPNRDTPEAQLFPMGYGGLRLFLRRLGNRALGKPVRPHLFRDSFATWLASKKVGRYQMCKLMGWAMSSNMPDRYIDRAGVVEEEAIQSIRGDDLSKVERENLQLKSTLKRLETQANELAEKLEERSDIDRALKVLLKNPEIGKIIRTNLSTQHGQEEKALLASVE